MATKNPRRFVTAVDTWLGAVVLIAPIAAVITTVALLITAPAAAWVGIAMLVFLGVIGWAIVWPIHYTLDGDLLKVRAGRFITKDIPIASITEVAPSSNPLSSPAFSMKRLRIDYKGGWILISPKERAAFLDALAAATNLSRDGENLS